MKFRNVVASAAALSFVAAPAVAEVSSDRASAPMEQESELGGGALIGALAVAAVIAGIVIIADDDDDGASA
ncbi:hypothetical protein [Alteriqipengyuania sp. 357]